MSRGVWLAGLACIVAGWLPATAMAGSTPSATSSMISAPAITLGDSVTDTATVSAGSAPSGSVSFYVCGPLSGPTGCTDMTNQLGTAIVLNPVSPTEAQATSAGFTPTMTGTYCIGAYYGGDSTFTTSSDTGSAGCFSVNPAATTTSSAPSATALQLGAVGNDTVTDDAVVQGNAAGGSPTGAVTFYACDPTIAIGACTGGAGAMFGTTDPVGVTGAAGNTAVADSDAFTPDAAGTWCFDAAYSGDDNYLASDDTPTSAECFTVAQGTTSTFGQPTTTSLPLGEPIADTANVIGDPDAGSPTGAVAFRLCGVLPSASGCTSSTGSAVGSGPVGLTGVTDPDGGPATTSTATSEQVTPATQGPWCFDAAYAGDANYTASDDGIGDDQCFIVTKGVATTAAAASASTIELGVTGADTITDTAVVTGNDTAGMPTGSVSFYACGPLGAVAGCTSTGHQIGKSVGVTGTTGATVTASSAPFAPTAAGTWCLHAVYSGNGNYNASDDPSTDQCFGVDRGATATTSTPSSTTTQLGSSITDLVSVAGDSEGGSPTGPVNVYICGPLPSAAGCTATAFHVGSGSVALTSAGQALASTTSPGVTPNALGTWCFNAQYPGDTNYADSGDTSPDGCFTVTKAAPTVTTQAQTQTTTLAAGDIDTATVAGNGVAGQPTGAVTFSACGPLAHPTGCASGGTTVGSGPVTVSHSSSGDVVTASSALFLPSAPGYWCFRADYPGDSSYLAGSDPSATDCVDVATPGAPTAAITNPVESSTYAFGQTVVAAFTCGDTQGSPGLASCTGSDATTSGGAVGGTVTAGGDLPTTTPGLNTFTVTALSKDGQSTSAVVHYTVLDPANQFKLSKPTIGKKGAITLKITVPGAGSITAAALDRVSVPRPPAHRHRVQAAFARINYSVTRATATGASTVPLTILPSHRAKTAIRIHDVNRLTVTVTFTPTPDGVPRSVTLTGLRVPM